MRPTRNTPLANVAVAYITSTVTMVSITWIQPRTNAVDYLGHPSDLEAMIGLEAVRRRSFDSWFSGIRDNPFGYWKPLY